MPSTGLLLLHDDEVAAQDDDGTLALGSPFSPSPSPASTTPADPTQTPARRRGGRCKDAIWADTTILPDKTVLCNHCHAAVHRYGCAKVERVRAHFKHRCLSAAAAEVLERANTANAANARDASASKSRSQGKGKPKRSSASGQRTAATTAAHFKRKLAHWLFATAQPLDMIENELLVSALRVLRADVSLPTRVELEGELLAAESAAAAAQAAELLAAKAFCLALESWTDATGGAHTSFAALCEGTPHFLETATPALAAREPAGVEQAATVIECVLATHHRSFLVGVVTPEAAMLSDASRERLQRQFPQCVFYYGCARHALRELVGDLCSILPWLEQTHASVSELLHVFQTRQTLRGHAPTSLLRVTGGVALSGADGGADGCGGGAVAGSGSGDQWRDGSSDSNTRGGEDGIGGFSRKSNNDCGGSAAGFYSSRQFFEMFEAILAAEKELYAAVSRRDFVDGDTAAERETLKRVQDFVLSETFVQDLERAANVVLPLQQRLEGFERGHLSLAHVYDSFSELLRTYSSMACVSKKERALISSCVSERLSSIYGDAHGVAYMLDPRFLGANLEGVQKQSAERFIVSYCSGGGGSGGIGGVDGIGGDSASVVDPARILGQLEKYKAMVHELKECNSTYWKMLELGKVRAFDFWVERRQFPQLQRLACAVLSLPCTSTAPARVFGAQCKLLHARFGGSLSTAKLQQLAQVYCNAKTTRADLSVLELVGGGDGLMAEDEIEHGAA
ncbi:hypothetical protein PybrP1_002573, partial [[Pythium] brassicae (nom. inval.)]